MSENETAQAKISQIFYTMLLFGGIAFYIMWSAVYGTWNLFVVENIGVYAVTVLMVSFGIVGILLNKKIMSDD